MKIGDPLDRSVQHGPQNHKAHLDKLVEYVETGLKEGARLVLGGKRCDRPGKIWFLMVDLYIGIRLINLSQVYSWSPQYLLM